MMRAARHLSLLMLALLGAALGCSFFGSRDRAAVGYEARRPSPAVPGDEVVYLDFGLVERPAGDEFLDRDVWESGDEQGVELELKPVLEENGLRVAQYGLLPDRLQSLLASPRFCPGPRRLRVRPETPTPLAVGDARPGCAFRVKLGGEARAVEFTDARCEFEVVPVPLEDGRVKLRFTPRVRHGRPRTQPHVAKDPDGQLRWAVETTEPTEDFDGLRFEVTVASGEFVTVGTWHERAGTLGHACFLPAGKKTQHLLVLRAGRVFGGDAESTSALAPLALQAGWASARGSSQ